MRFTGQKYWTGVMLCKKSLHECTVNSIIQFCTTFIDILNTVCDILNPILCSVEEFETFKKDPSGTALFIISIVFIQTLLLVKRAL